MNSYTAYLCLIRFMFKLNVPFEDRMSMSEFEKYAAKIRNKKASI